MGSLGNFSQYRGRGGRASLNIVEKSNEPCTCKRDLCPVLSVHIVGVVKELGYVVSVLLSKEPFGVVARVVATDGLAVGQDEKEESKIPHAGDQHGHHQNGSANASGKWSEISAKV